MQIHTVQYFAHGKGSHRLVYIVSLGKKCSSIYFFICITLPYVLSEMQFKSLNFFFDDIRRKIQHPLENMTNLTLVKKRKLRCFGHIFWASGLAKTILQGTVEEKKRRQCRQKKWIEDTIRNGQGWTLLFQLGQLKTGIGAKGLL